MAEFYLIWRCSVLIKSYTVVTFKCFSRSVNYNNKNPNQFFFTLLMWFCWLLIVFPNLSIEYGQWTAFSECFGECGHFGHKKRHRSCLGDGTERQISECKQNALNDTFNETESCYNEDKPCYSKPGVIITNFKVLLKTINLYRATLDGNFETG